MAVEHAAESDAIETHWRSVRHVLTVHHLLQLAQASHCAIADVGRVRGAGDPQHVIAGIADAGFYLRGCSQAERLALEIEIVCGDLPIVVPRGPVHVVRGYRRGRERLSRCLLLSRALGELVGERRYYDLVADGFERVSGAISGAGRLQDGDGA
jgi:hypothetical protein